MGEGEKVLLSLAALHNKVGKDIEGTIVKTLNA
jgi:hypothetical protein